LASRVCGAVVIARDEGKFIEKCLASIRSQTSRIFIVVVNDGSADDTALLSSRYADVVLNLTRHVESWVGRPELARVFNAGFDVLRKQNVDYVLVSGADSVYPSSYVETIIKKMEKSNVVLASGVARGEVVSSVSPRGSGRIIHVKWFKRIGFRYPENYGFEGYLVYKALSQGLKVAVANELQFSLLRGTRSSKQKWYLWGKGMRTLNYWWLYAFGRIISVSLRQPKSGSQMLRGYLNCAKKYEDLADFVPRFQARTLLRRLVETLRGQLN